MVKQIDFAGNIIEFPDDVPDERISEILKQRAPEYRKMFGIPEAEPPKESFLSDIYGFGKKGVGEGISGAGWLADKATGYGSAMQKYGNEVTEAADATISAEAKERAARPFITDAEPGKGMFGYEFNPSALAGVPYQAAQSIPGMVAGLGATALATAVAPEAAVVGRYRSSRPRTLWRTSRHCRSGRRWRCCCHCCWQEPH